ncbi:SusC/RagA family TonB-linked outer membrane protein [Niabella hirudinis]|uniref:SusC/RagA family TonB-linked outer membrane protein n=1 Tax=Niabella hirudinis TaxID=1285929 RepID=UPI003EC0A5C9
MILGIVMCLFSYSQGKITVVGSVLDSTRVPLMGVTVSDNSTKTALTATDVNGRFVLDVASGTTLSFSFVGFVSQTLLVSGKPDTATIIVLKNAAINAGEEVVVTSFGQKKMREAVTGSVTTVKPENLRIPSSNLTNALAGQVAGIVAYQPNGQPGYDNSEFFIRGVTTFGYASSPLIIIDNMESSATDLARLQVDDIESFSILKDAGATALYGARGANGVILVSTKKGREGKPNFYMKLENSISAPTQRLKIADPVAFMQGYNEATTTRNPTAGDYYTADKIYFTRQTMQGAPDGNPYVYPANDWLSMLFKNRTNNQRANLNISGGGGVATYFISGSYNLDNGILKVSPVNNFNNNVKLQNYQLRTNIDVNVTKSTKLSLLMNGIFDDYNGPLTSNANGTTDMWALAMRTDPVGFPAYYAPDSANAYTQHVLFGNTAELGVNPYAQLLRGYTQTVNSTINVQLSLNQDLKFITPGLKFSGNLQLRRTSGTSTTRQYRPFYYTVLPNNYNPLTQVYQLSWLNASPGAATEYLDYARSGSDVNAVSNLQAFLNYDRTFGNLHTVSGRVIAWKQQTISNKGADLTLQSSLPFRNLVYSGGLAYTYDKRYTATFDFGYNGSERFSENNRFGFFPTAGAAWIVSNEKFWDGSAIAAVVSKLKLRGSYGVVGNDNISGSRFFYLSGVNLNGGNGASFGATNGYSRPGVTISNYPNPFVTWERSYQTNLAAELTLFHSLNIVAEIYQQKRENIYQNRLPIATMGLEAAVGANLGKTESKGLDLQLDYSKTISNDVTISARGNLTYTQGKYSYFEEPAYPGQPWRRRTGSLLGQQMGYIAERLFVDEAEVANSPAQFPGTMGGDIKYRDVNSDGLINTADMVPIGNPVTPQITYGFGPSARIKDFDIAFFFQGTGKRSFFIDPYIVSPFLTGSVNTNKNLLLQDFADNHWSESSRNLYALYPRYVTSSTQLLNNGQTSTWWMRDGSFVRLKSIELGYSLRQNLLQKYRIKSFRIYASGLNLFLFSKFKTWDIEQAGNGFAYPIQKTFNIGIQTSIN